VIGESVDQIVLWRDTRHLEFLFLYLVIRPLWCRTKMRHCDNTTCCHGVCDGHRENKTVLVSNCILFTDLCSSTVYTPHLCTLSRVANTDTISLTVSETLCDFEYVKLCYNFRYVTCIRMSNINQSISDTQSYTPSHTDSIEHMDMIIRTIVCHCVLIGIVGYIVVALVNLATLNLVSLDVW